MILNRVKMEMESTAFSTEELSGERNLSSSYPQDDIRRPLMPEPQRVEVFVTFVFCRELQCSSSACSIIVLQLHKK
jgi:hypothetical protein